MRMWLLLAIGLAVGGGCLDAGSPAEAPGSGELPGAAEPLLFAPAGTPMSIGSKALAGDVALELSFAESGGSCTTEMRASRRSNDEGPTMLRVVDNLSWTYNVGSSPAVGAGGSEQHLVPAAEGDFGFLPVSLETPVTIQYWANDVADTGSPRTYGAAFWAGWVCDRDTAVTLRGARQAFLASAADFAPYAGANVPFAGGAVLNGWFSVDGPRLLDLFYLLPGAGDFDLAASRLGQPLSLGEPGGIQTLPAGPIKFTLTGAGAAGDVVLAGARFQAIRSSADLEALPT